MFAALVVNLRGEKKFAVKTSETWIVSQIDLFPQCWLECFEFRSLPRKWMTSWIAGSKLFLLLCHIARKHCTQVLTRPTQSRLRRVTQSRQQTVKSYLPWLKNLALVMFNGSSLLVWSWIACTWWLSAACKSRTLSKQELSCRYYIFNASRFWHRRQRRYVADLEAFSLSIPFRRHFTRFKQKELNLNHSSPWWHTYYKDQRRVSCLCVRARLS